MMPDDLQITRTALAQHIPESIRVGTEMGWVGERRASASYTSAALRRCSPSRTIRIRMSGYLNEAPIVVGHHEDQSV